MANNSRFRRLFRMDNDPSDVGRAVDDELQFHFDLAVRDLIAKGLSESEARRQAEERFGDVERTRLGLKAIDRARVRESRRVEWWSNVWQDVRYALRGLRRKPGFAIAVVVILALGIGANATMFGIVDRLLLQPPALLLNTDRVHRVYLSSIVNDNRFYSNTTSYHRFRDLTDSARSIDAAAAFSNSTIAVGIENPREFRVTFATAGLWKMFDVRPELGRFFTASEDIPTNPAKVVVLSHGFWQSDYGGDTDVLGKTIRLGRLDFTIIGVAPKGFAGFSTQTPIAFVPLASGAENSFPGNGRTRWYETYGMNWLQVVVRRKADVSLESITAEFTTGYQRSYDAARAINKNITAAETAKPFAVVSSVLTSRGPNQGTDVKVAVWLVGVALIVLVIACANVSNLLLARALERRREIAVRLALGISRGRLLLQLMTESTVLALMGGVAGLAVTEWGGRILRSSLLPDVAWSNTLFDPRTAAFTLVMAIVAGLATGLVPAWKAGRTGLSSALKAGAREGAQHRSKLRASLLVIQATLSVVLLVGAGLFVRSLNNVQGMRLGFDAEKVLWVDTRMRGVQLDTIAERTLFNELVRTAETLPVTEYASYGLSVPFWSEWEVSLFVPGIDSVDKLGAFELQVVSPNYFKTMGTRIIRGRGFDDTDRPGAERAVVVSESMARKLWPGKDALAQCIRVNADTVPCSYVVGIAEDIKSNSLTKAEQWQYYLPISQVESGQGGVLFVRVKGDPATQTESVRAALQKVMPSPAYLNVKPLADLLDPERRSWQLGATMFTIFGLLALLVAGIGLYSVISYSVAQRTQEMGVRMALGAQTRDVVRIVLRQSVTLSVVAIMLGVGVAMVASTWIKPLLFQTSSRDPLVYGSVAATLLLVAVMAALAPALRASRVDASVALRSE